MEINLTLRDISEEEMLALANFIKRIGYEEYSKFAETEDDNRNITIAMSALRIGINQAGYEVW